MKKYHLTNLAKDTGIPYATLYYWMLTDIIAKPTKTIGRSVHYTKEEYENLVKQLKENNEEC